MKKKILVADNHPVMRKFMTRLLEKHDYVVRTAEDGLSALDVLESFIPDVLFIDLVMPNIPGDKLCRIIRTMPSLNHAYIVILSGIVAEKNLDWEALGVNACIAKGPIDKMTGHILFALEQSEQDPPCSSPHKVIGIEDVYEREVSRELLSSKKQLECILDNMTEGIVVLNPDGRIIYANSTAISLIGIAEEKLLALPFSSFFDKTHRGQLQQIIEGSVSVPQTVGEDLSLTLNGRQVLLSMLPRKNDLQQTVIIKDISEKMKMEEQLRQARMMESIGTLAGGIAHQFNNALSVITGNIELLRMSRPDDSKVFEFIEPIRKSAYRMTHLTSQLLAYARGGKYNPEVMSLSDFIENSFPLIRHSINPAIQIETHLAEDSCYIEADSTQMQMVLSAVVTNAAEAIEGKGHIRIAAGVENVTTPPIDIKPGVYACLHIEDDGKGMDEETQSRIFEPFFTTNFQGRGLGMAAVSGIIQNHGGWISVESEPGKGTALHIYLPVVNNTKKEERKVEDLQLSKGSDTVLVIEDEEIILDICRTMLEKLNYKVLAASTGEDAVTVAKTFDGGIDVALLDIGLPDIDGKNLYPLLMQARPDLKVIVCSGFGLDGPVQEILNSGAQGFIQKPYAFNALSAKLKDVLEGQ